MPSRRNTLIGLGILAAGGTGAVATGAFSAATAERTVNVNLAGDAAAIIGLESTSLYTNQVGDNSDELQFAFNNLNRDARFTFNDVFVIRNNNPNQTIRLTDIGSATENAYWEHERGDNEDESPAKILIATTTNAWQGSTPDQTNIENNGIWTFSDEDPESYDANEGSQALSDASDGVEIPSEEFLAIGFQFGYDDFDSWTQDDIPNELQLTFDTLEQEQS